MYGDGNNKNSNKKNYLINEQGKKNVSEKIIGYKKEERKRRKNDWKIKVRKRII